MISRWIFPAVLLIAIGASLLSAQGMAPSLQSAGSDDLRIPRLQIVNAPVLQALDTLLRGTPRDYRIVPGTRVEGMVTADLQDVPLDGAVAIVLRNAGLQATREGNTYIIGPQLVPGVAAPQQQMVPMSTGGAIGTVDVKPAARSRTFDILLDKANVLEAIRQILEVAGQNYVIDTGLDCAWAGPLGPRISARMRGIGLDEAVEALANSASLVMTKVGTTYAIRPPDGAIPFSYTQGAQGKQGAKTGTGMKETPACGKCARPIAPGWQFCPFCGTPVRFIGPPTK